MISFITLHYFQRDVKFSNVIYVKTLSFLSNLSIAFLPSHNLSEIIFSKHITAIDYASNVRLKEISTNFFVKRTML